MNKYGYALPNFFVFKTNTKGVKSCVTENIITDMMKYTSF